MTLIGAILKKVKSADVIKYPSPPPEVNAIVKRKRKKYVDNFAHVHSKVDSRPPVLQAARMFRRLPGYRRDWLAVHAENVRLLVAIKKAHFNRGKVDCKWKVYPPGSEQYYRARVHFYQQICRANKDIYRRILNTTARVEWSAWLERDWRVHRAQMINNARKQFVLFPPAPTELIEDAAFAPPPGVRRPRVYLTLKMHKGSELGTLAVELFADVCPRTCSLFLELMDGEAGYGYVGTCFFRKVPGLYWSGGDVVYNNGFGCYAQRGRTVPIGAENYHFSHSMPGLLSMRVTRNDEMCGIFNITFKPLHQLDLHNVVFGRVIRPSKLFEAIQSLGSPLSTHPRVNISGARRRANNRWIRGVNNSRITELRYNLV